MPTYTFTLPEDPQDALVALNNRLSWMFAKLDSKNVKRLDTNETVVKSADGTTYLNGSQIEMRDVSDVMRLLAGLDKSTGKFIFTLSTPDGSPGFYVDDNGQIHLEGTPLIEMYDDQATPVLRLKMGLDTATGDFVFTLYNALGTKNIELDSSANGDGIITGGTVRTAASGARIVMKNNIFAMYDSANRKNGLYLDPQFADIIDYHADVECFRMRNEVGSISLQSYEISFLTSSGSGTTCLGSWDFDGTVTKSGSALATELYASGEASSALSSANSYADSVMAAHILAYH